MDRLTELQQHYRRKFGNDDSWVGLKSLYARYIKEREQSILDAAASGVVLQNILSTGEIDFDQVTPQMHEAFHSAYPNVEFSSLADRSPEELAGFINGWKGKLFEIDVRDRLMAGEWVGDLHLEPGQTVELAASATQPGWDLAIHNADGTLADQLQLKATASLAYVKDAIERYPDIHVLATDGVGDIPDHLNGMISVADISNDQLTDMVSEPLSDVLSDSLLDTLLPGLPLVLIGLTEGHGVATGKRTKERAIERAVSRTGKGILAGLVGWALSAVVGDVTGVLGGVAVRMLMGGEKDEPAPVEVNLNYQFMNERLEKAIDVPQLLLPYYPSH